MDAAGPGEAGVLRVGFGAAGKVHPSEMDRIYSDSNEENDHTEHKRRQRLSSILKAPRSPLKDLGSGNEFTQDYDIEKRRKNSRRVSFADTIKVFQTDVQANTVEPENTERAANIRNQVLDNQNEAPEVVLCKITGMDTLLHAPIQTPSQQTEWHDMDNNQMNTNDRTLIFSDENEMDMTASHTAMITRNLKSNEEIDKPRKIDIKSFLAGLTSKNEGPDMNKEYHFFCDPTEVNYARPSLQQKPAFDTVKKINFDEFLTSLKSSEMFANPIVEGPEKENMFFVPLQGPKSTVFSPVKYVYSHVQENTDNVTRIFRGEDNGMDITKCHVSNIKTIFPNTCEATSKQLECGDVTVTCGDMDMTASQTVKISDKNKTLNIEIQSQNIQMDLSSSFVADKSRLKRASSCQLIDPQDQQSCGEKKTVNAEDEEGLTRSHTVLIDNHKGSQTSNQVCRTMTVVPGCVSSERLFHGDKTVVFSSYNDMEITGNHTVINCSETSSATGKSCYKTFQKPGNAISLLMEKTVSEDDDMDITKCQITSDNQVLKQCKNNTDAISSVPDNTIKKGIQRHRATSETLGLESCANPGSWTSKGAFQHSSVNSLLVSLPSDKTIIFSGEDMDLTRSYIAKDVEKGVKSQLPTVSAGMSVSLNVKPHIFGNKTTSSNLNEQEEMDITKCHVVVIDNQNIGINTSQQQMQPKTTSGENWNREVSEVASPLNLDNENILSGMDDRLTIRRSHPSAQTIHFSSQEQDSEIHKSHTIASNSCVQKPLQRQNCEISQQLRKSLVNPSFANANNRTVVFPDDQGMDITRNHTAALDFAPIFVAQEYESTHIQNSLVSNPQQLQNKTLFFSGGSDIDITRSQTAAIECGSLRMYSNQGKDTHENIPALSAPRFSFTSGDKILPSVIKGNVHFGKIPGIQIDSKNSELRQQSHTMAALNNIPTDTANSEQFSSTSKATSLSSKLDFTKSQTVATDDMHLRSVEQLPLARTSKPDTKCSQLPSRSEKSVVFFSEENMDLTGSGIINVPDTILTERKDILFPKKKDLTSCHTVIGAGSLQQQECNLCPLTYGQKTFSRNDLQLSPSNEKTVIFSLDDDMEMTKSHMMTTNNTIHLQGKNSSNVIPLIPASKTIVFTCDDDMEITRPNTVVIDKPMEKAASQTLPELDKGNGRKNLIGATSEKTVVFSLGDENDMEMTKGHTMETDNKIYLQGQSSSNVGSLIAADESIVFTCDDDMEITRPNTVVIDKPMEEAATQTLPELDKERGRKNLIGATSEKTVVFSLGDENDMEMTKGHTMETDNKIYLQGQSSSNVVSLIPADESIVFTCDNDMEITRPNTVVIDKPMEKAASQTLPELDKESGRKNLIGATIEKTVVLSLGGENDMKITKSHMAAINDEIVPQSERVPQAQSVVHADKMVFIFNHDNIEITESHSVDKTVEKVMHVDRLKPGKWIVEEAFSNSKTVVFAEGDDMETTNIHTVSLDDEIALQGGQSTHFCPVFSVNETAVFTCNQDMMDITASHTVAVNSNNLKEAENQQVSSKCHQQQNLCSSSAPTCREKIHFKQEDDVGNGCHSRNKHESDTPDFSGVAFSYKMDETDILKIHSIATEKSICPVTVSLPEDTLDIVREPQNAINLPKGNSNSVYCQDLGKQVKPKSKRVSFKLPGNEIESSTYKIESQRKEIAKNNLSDCDGENGSGMSWVQIPVQQLHLPKEITDCLNRCGINVLSTGDIDLKGDPGKLTSSRREQRPTELAIDGADAKISYKENKENEGVSAEGEKLTKDSQKDLEQAQQLSQVNDIPAEQVDPSLMSELSDIVNICSRLKNFRRKSEVVPDSQSAAVSNLAEQFPKLVTQPQDLLSLGKDIEREFNNAVCTKEKENTYFETGDASVGTSLDTVQTDKFQVRRLTLGIFPPKLPNRRNSTVSSVEDTHAKSSDDVEAQVSDVNLITSKTPDNIYPTGMKNLSPSQYIGEELLPMCPEEMDSVESVSYEPFDGTCGEMNKKEIFHKKISPLEEQETCSSQKRVWEEEEEELQKGKKMKRAESWDGDVTKEQQAMSGSMVSYGRAETHEGENTPTLSAKSLERTNSSSSSCLDSLKADTDLSMQRSSQMESQLLMDSICEQNLFKKFQDGVITVGEFFTLLQVHILIQKPRQSHLPANYAVNTAATPEDLIFSQYIYRPKLQIYEEDCQVLSQLIEDLKLCVGAQDKLLVDVNKSLWEVLKTCSDKELKSFGTDLNKMKSCFTKKSKVLAHKGKVKLYGNLVQKTQIQWEKLQSRIAKVDEFLREMDSCLSALETVTKLEECGTDISDPVEECKSKVINFEKELENLKAQEEALQRNLSDLEFQKQQGFSEIKRLQNIAHNCQEFLNRYNFTEWEISEWSNHQAVFTFLYDSIELTITFGPPVDGAVFNYTPGRKIVDVSFESLLDEEKAPHSSCLVQRLIFQFIESQGSWQTKCTSFHHLPQMLHEISLVVNHCRLLGEEIEFLHRWGGKFNLLKTEVDNTKVKLLFSTATAFAKFEVTLSLSANYPSAPLPFTVQKRIGNLGHDEISPVLSNVPLGTNYLIRMVKMIHHNLLQGSLTVD